MSFTYNTVFTNYAFSKLCDSLIEEGVFYNLITIKIGDGENSLNLNKTSLSNALYTLNITDTKIVGNSVVFTAVIPEDVSDIKITEIGLFDNIDGEEKLFSYSKVDAVKPSDLGYELVVELNLTLRTVNFSGKLNIKVNEFPKATKNDYKELDNVFLYIETNLEKCIDYNSTKVGLFIPQLHYKEEQKLNEITSGFNCYHKYFGLLNRFGSSIRNCFYLKEEDFLTYTLKDTASDTALINVYSNMISSQGDSINFSGEGTLCFSAKIGTNVTNTNILNKIQYNSAFDVDTYFTLDLIDGNSLVLKIISEEGTEFKMVYAFDDNEYVNLTENYNNYIISINSTLDVPSCTLFINGESKNIEVYSDTMRIPDKSQYSLRNYLIVNNANTINENLDIRNIVFLSQLVTRAEAHLLYISQRVRNT